MEQEIIERIKNGQFKKILLNSTFFDFYDELVRQFTVNNFPTDDLYIVKDQERYYLLDDNIRMSENVIVLFNQDRANIKFLPHQEGVELFRFEIIQKGKGIGTQLMNLFLAAAKQLNIKIYLNPNYPGLGKPGKNDEKMMKQFFHRCGFNPIPGSDYWIN